jgi:hypothetical protein
LTNNEAPPGIAKIEVNNGAIVRPVINVNAKSTAKFTPGVCFTLGITKKKIPKFNQH